MTLAEFRATRRLVTVDHAREEFPFFADMDFESMETKYLHIYQDGYWIAETRKGLWLAIECDEYESRDLAMLEFILWLWAVESDETVKLHETIWPVV